ncbi:MAG: response regulator transcription factor [Pyrinomonadaceae bacterium]
MRVLIAEDDPVSRLMLEATLEDWGHEVVVTSDGDHALAELQKENAPRLAILDWMMPGMDGPEICQRLRRMQTSTPVYILILTAKSSKEEIVAGLKAGANDYLTKPFDGEELRARVQVGATVVELQRTLAERVAELEDSILQVKQLQGILPICSYCKNVRDDQNYWQRVESYVADHTDAKFSHSICPECYEAVVKPELAKVKSDRAE